MARNFQQIDELRINGRNYDRTRCQIVISGAIGAPFDMTDYVRDINYSDTADVQFDYTLGSRRPSDVGFGNIVSEGNLVLNDAGVIKLNELATIALSLPSMLYLGQSGQIDITITYTLYNGAVKQDLLQHVYFTQYNNGVNTTDVLNSRDVALMIGKINIGNIQ